MSKQKTKRKQNSKISGNIYDNWMLHDIYSEGRDCNRIITRSQVAFIRLKNTESDLKLFADSTKPQPPGMPHLMNIIKGEYGAVPRTIITRRLAKSTPVSKTLCENIDKYKTEPSIGVTLKKDQVGEKETKENVVKVRKKEEEKQETEGQVNEIKEKQETEQQVKDSKEKQEMVADQYNEVHEKSGREKMTLTGYRQSQFLGEYNRNFLTAMNDLIFRHALIVGDLFRNWITIRTEKEENGNEESGKEAKGERKIRSLTSF